MRSATTIAFYGVFMMDGEKCFPLYRFLVGESESAVHRASALNLLPAQDDHTPTSEVECVNCLLDPRRLVGFMQNARVHSIWSTSILVPCTVLVVESLTCLGAGPILPDDHSSTTTFRTVNTHLSRRRMCFSTLEAEATLHPRSREPVSDLHGLTQMWNAIVIHAAFYV